ncbi:MAG: hypothetical protein Q9181_002061, partial [Wetmoreana brouardii]
RAGIRDPCLPQQLRPGPQYLLIDIVNHTLHIEPRKRTYQGPLKACLEIEDLAEDGGEGAL